MTDIERPTSTPGSILERASHQARPFKVARVEKTAAPDGSDGTGWDRHGRGKGKTTIPAARASSPGKKNPPPMIGGVSTETCDAGAVYAGVTFAADGPFGPCVNSN